MQEQTAIDLTKYLRALVALQIHTSSKEELPRMELALSGAGFSAREIADLTGRSQAAVAKALSRAKAARVSTDQEATDE